MKKRIEQPRLKKRNEKIIQLLRQGKSPKQLASKFHLPETGIRYIAFQRGEVTVSEHLERQKKRRKKIIAALKKHVSATALRKQFNIGKQTTCYYIAKYNISSYYTVKKKKRDDAILRLLRKKVSPKKIASRFNIVRETVYNVAHGNRIYLNNYQADAIRQLLKAGWQPMQIVKKIKGSSQNVYFLRKLMRLKNEL